MPILFVAAAGGLGWLAGVVVNYLADVLPMRRRLTRPFCMACDQPIRWANYVFAPRRCSECGQRRSIRTWIVELIFICLGVWLWLRPPDRLGFWTGMLLLAYFGLVVLVDIEHRLILHMVSLTGAVVGLIVGVYWYGLVRTLLGGLAGFGIMLCLYLFGELLLRILMRVRGVPSDEVALGFGDVMLGGVIGLMLGWPVITMGLMAAVLIGGIFSLVYLIFMQIAHRYQMFTALPYGPFLVGGAILLLYFREILSAWLG